jgi:D-serine deaminase-like pyridoxal phosphate-dependent protein
VQTPLVGPGARGLRIGDRVWFRHAKAGEVCEHVNVLHAVAGSAIEAEWPTYRGEGQAFL